MKAFSDEITKTAGAGMTALKAIKKRPLRSLIGASILGGTAMAASEGHKKGLRGGEKGKYIKATRSAPSRAALLDYHQLFKHKPSRKAVRRLSKHHKPSTFASYGSRPKKKE